MLLGPDFFFPADEIPDLLYIVDHEALLSQVVEFSGDPPRSSKQKHPLAVLQKLDSPLIVVGFSRYSQD